MGLNPLVERGIPIHRQLRSWSELNVLPYDKRAVHPYTRARVIAMNGIETESILFSHQFSRHTDEPFLKTNLALLRRTEQEQQKVLRGLVPGDQSCFELALCQSQAVVDLTAVIARSESDPYLQHALEFTLVEHIDHLYRCANLLHLQDGSRATSILGNLTPVEPGRPTIAQHRHPFDDVRKHYDRHSIGMLSRMHVLTILSIEQDTMSFYMNGCSTPTDALARGFFQEIGQIEEQHVTHIESLLDPLESWLEREVMHHYNECYMYYSFLMQEVDRRLRQIWELHLHMEFEHLRIACEMMQKFQGIEPEEILPKELPEPARLESHKEYLRTVIAAQTDLTGWGPEIVSGAELPKGARYFEHQRAVNSGGPVPSERIILEQIRREGADYRSDADASSPIHVTREGKCQSSW
jgi:hypothetical protein